MSGGPVGTERRILGYSDGILEAFEYLLERYPEVFVIGQGLWSPWYVGNSMRDLDKKFGRERIIDYPGERGRHHLDRGRSRADAVAGPWSCIPGSTSWCSPATAS